jgi:hypothetical protein
LAGLLHLAPQTLQLDAQLLRRRNCLRQLAPGIHLGLFDPGQLIAQRL